MVTVLQRPAGQLGHHHDEITDAGAQVTRISVDPPEQNAAMAEKLQLPFPLLSDPGGDRSDQSVRRVA
ncbi:MAG: redoxin domain-containing protein [Actinobacteria bacterium]|nr:redoxin domain-containing protein [Actinomycetota bacterium]